LDDQLPHHSQLPWHLLNRCTMKGTSSSLHLQKFCCCCLCCWQGTHWLLRSVDAISHIYLHSSIQGSSCNIWYSLPMQWTSIQDFSLDCFSDSHTVFVIMGMFADHDYKL
jgi:hypothetical protein